ALEERGVLVLGSDAGLLDDRQADAARRTAAAAGMQVQPVFTYLANTMRVGGREVPYSLVTALDLGALGVEPGPAGEPLPGEAGGRDAPIVLTTWAADDLQAQTGDRLDLEYYVWQDPGRLVTR